MYFIVILFPKQLEAEDSLRKREGKSSRESLGNSLADESKVVGPVVAGKKKLRRQQQSSYRILWPVVVFAVLFHKRYFFVHLNHVVHRLLHATS